MIGSLFLKQTPKVRKEPMMKTLLIITGLMLGLTASNAAAQEALNLQQVSPVVVKNALVSQLLTVGTKTKIKEPFALKSKKRANKTAKDARKSVRNRLHTGRSDQFSNPTELFLHGSLIDRAIYLNN